MPETAMASICVANTINSAVVAVIPTPLRQRFGIAADDEVTFEPQQGAIVMKPAKIEKINRKGLHESPAWLTQARKRAQKSPLAQMTDEEVGRYCEELAEKAAKKRATKVG